MMESSSGNGWEHQNNNNQWIPPLESNGASDPAEHAEITFPPGGGAEEHGALVGHAGAAEQQGPSGQSDTPKAGYSSEVARRAIERRAGNPEAALAVAHAMCRTEIDARVDEAIAAGPEGIWPALDSDADWGPLVNTTGEIKVVREMLSSAVHSKNRADVLRYAERLRALPGTSKNDLAEANFAAAINGDKPASNAIHEALSTERALLEQPADGTVQDDPHKPPLGSLHYTVIRKCAEYGITADHWIEPYALDTEDRWQKTQYLFDHMPAATTDANAVSPDVKQARDAHAAHLFEMPDAFFATHLPEVIEQVSNPNLRDLLIQRYDSVRPTMPATYDMYLGSTRVALCKVLNNDATTAKTAIDTIDGWTKTVLRGYGPQHASMSRTEWEDLEMQQRNDRLSKVAHHFAGKGDFEQAQKVSAAMMQRDFSYGRLQAQLLLMASEPAHLEPFRKADRSLMTEADVAVEDDGLEIATLRIAGDVDGLIARTVEHLNSIRDPRTAETIAVFAHNSRNVNYAHHVYNAIEKVDAVQLAKMGRQVLPIVRDLGEGGRAIIDMPWLTCKLSDALMAAGDTEELQTVMAEGHRLSSVDTGWPPAAIRAVHVRTLWDVAQRIGRAREAYYAQQKQK